MRMLKSIIKPPLPYLSPAETRHDVGQTVDRLVLLPGSEAHVRALTLADQTWLARFETYLVRHHASIHLSIPDLADHFAMSQSTLLRQVRRLTGQTPVRRLRRVRLERARRLLAGGRYTAVQQVAAAVGYCNTGSFSRCFKAYYGLPPSDCLPR
ncbi:MAG: hypothetical protein OHK0039_40570 [Bacteroidia bacterium]